MNYFLLNSKKFDKKKHLINSRRKRKVILSSVKMGKVFTRGDILILNFWTKTLRYHFEGICLGLKKKSFIQPNVTLSLRNVLFSIGIEISASFYFNRLFINTLMSDFKRKKFQYRSSKLYYLCSKENQATRIKA